MRKLAVVTITAAIGLLGALAVATPALAAVGQCFDAYGRRVGPPHNTDNPPYAMICDVYRRGGSCTHVGAGWAESNCGYNTPRYQYRDDRYRYRDDRYRYPRY